MTTLRSTSHSPPVDANASSILVERRAAPVIVIARRAVDRRLICLTKPSAVGGEMFVLNQITGEADKLRRELIDRAHDLGRVIVIAFVVEIGEMDEAKPTGVEDRGS